MSQPSPCSTNDGQIFTIDDLIRQRATQLGNATLIGYPKTDVADYEEHSARAVDGYVDAAAHVLQHKGLELNPQAHASVVAILGQPGLHVIITTLALSRLGYAVLLLSTRLPSPAISRLLDLTNCHYVLTTPNYHSVLEQVRETRQVDVADLLVHQDYCDLHVPPIERTYDAQVERHKTCIIIHSSGSTGLPKPIFLTHKSCIASFSTHLNRKALITSPFFHSHCFYETFRSIYSGKPIYYCNYALPLTKASVIAMLNRVKPELFHCVPYVLKLLAGSEDGNNALARVDFVLFAGSACPDDLGNDLVKHGVNLNANYGATETGRLMTSARPPGDDAWDYLRILPQVQKYVLMDEVAPNLYECVALDGLHSKNTINSDTPPQSFRTRDLFTPHPTQPGLWKYASRLDDRFTLVNGEKVLPLPIEGRIRQESAVKEAIVFGNGRTVPGVLIVKSDLAENSTNSEFLDYIWPAVADANSRAEGFAQIPKELIVILNANTPYPSTDKGTVIRGLAYTQFESEIEAAYSRFEIEIKGGSLTLAGSELEAHLLHMFKEHVGVRLASIDADFFANGIDSLQCIKMWNLIKRSIDLGGHHVDLGQNVIYESGCVRSLAAHLESLRAGIRETTSDETASMQDLIHRYSNFPRFTPTPGCGHHKDVVLLTGATGGLGAHLLAQLVASSQITAVWALVRSASDKEAHQRVMQSLGERNIALTPDRYNKIVALSANLSKENLGLTAERYSDLQRALTAAIHCAWAVNFTIPVSSFEDQHIKAVHSLITLCQSTISDQPARFFFCSSVSVAGNTSRPGTVAESTIVNTEHVQHTGYARSKFVAEHITANAVKRAGACARNLRVGQLIGDTKTGQWNTTEAIPLMMQTSRTLGVLPTLEEEMSWLPVDIAAAIIAEIALGEDKATDPDLVYHILNPTRFHWTRDMLPALHEAGLSFDALPTDQWMKKLRSSSRDPVCNPPIKLLDWFESKYGGPPKTGNLHFVTTETAKRSSIFRSIPSVLDPEFLGLMVDKLKREWERSGP